MTSVAVIGLGYVGQANVRAFARAGFTVAGYDPHVRADTYQWAHETQPYPSEQVAAATFAVICVGTPQAFQGGHADLTHLLDALEVLPPQVPVLLRSTVPPGTTDMFRGRLIAHAPEFMHERPGGAWSETTDVPFLILGGTYEACSFFRPYLSQLWPKIHETTALAAEITKFTVNLHLATRITFINEMAQIAGRFGADWEDVRQAWLNDPRITPEYTGMAGFGPGFGGRCWPKDLAALIAASEDAGYVPEFLKAVQEANRRFQREG